MQDATHYRELARRYGFAATPESVSRLTQLVAAQDCDMAAITDFITKDPALSARLLRVANPGQKEGSYQIDTVEGAIMRNGIGCVLLLAMGTPLALVLVKTFLTMLSLKLESVDPQLAPALQGEHVLSTIAFSGKSIGRVYLRLSLAAAKVVAARITGLDVKELTDPAVVNDAVGELLNIMTGNFKSNLCDAGLDCRLEPPVVERTRDLQTPIVAGGGLERLAFRSGQLYLFVDITVNPWHGS
jgi:CheY-specific phosphatase CheX